uniref:Secreted protein n=1 Tax=Panagrellus redivivus TaxID=6233 RepID=A0A7E4W4Q1_PANRE
MHARVCVCAEVCCKWHTSPSVAAGSPAGLATRAVHLFASSSARALNQAFLYVMPSMPWPRTLISSSPAPQGMRATGDVNWQHGCCQWDWRSSPFVCRNGITLD